MKDVLTEYRAEAYIHRTSRFEEFLFAIDAAHLRPGDRVWFNGDWTYSYTAEPHNVKPSGKYRTVKSVKHDEVWRIVEVRFKNPLVRRSYKDEDTVMIDAGTTRGWIQR